MKRLIGYALGALVLSVMLAPTALAAEFIKGDDNGNVTLSSTETHRNAYLAGGTVFVNSKTEGDLYGAGGDVTIEGDVEQDVVIAAGDVTINGKVGGDVRVIGGNVVINQSVGGDVLVAGGTLRLTERASVTGDVFFGGGDITLDAPVLGKVGISADTVTLNSKVEGFVKVTAGHSFTIGSKAVIPNTITYEGNNEQVVQEGAQVGTINFEEMKNREGNAGKALGGLFTMMFVIKSLGLILAGLLLLKLFPRTAQKTVEMMQNNRWQNLGIGALTLIVGPIAFLIALITFVGMYIAFAWLFVWLLMLIIAALVACTYAGAWIIKMTTSRAGLVYNWQALALGVVVMGIVMLVPVIGGLIFFVLLLMAFGGIIRQLFARIRSEQANEPAPQSLNI